MGNQPGDQCGDVLVRLAAPLEDVTVPSGDLVVLAEAGAFYGLFV
jgi:hypothetical protein